MTTVAPATNLTASQMYHGWMPTPDVRGTTDLLWSCFSTIALCVWTAIHLPIPSYSREKPKFSVNWRNWLRQKMKESRLVPALISFVVPEFLAFVAVQEFLKARATRKSLDLTSKGLTHSFFLNMGGFCLRSPDGTLFQLDHSLLVNLANGSEATSDSDETDPTSETSVRCHPECWIHGLDDLSERGSLGVIEHKATSDIDSANATGSIFFASHTEEWIHQLAKFDENDITALSKGDSSTKTIACFQALWFVTQVISRVVESRAVTLLEVSTCSYVFCAFITYVAWWKKPQNCSVPLMIDCSDDVIARLPRSGYGDIEGTWAEFIWSGASWEVPLPFALSFNALPLCFGAIHVAAWKIALPSQIELWMWRSSTILCCGYPFVNIMPLEAWYLIRHRSFSGNFYGLPPHLPCWQTMVITFYVAVRVYMIIEIFISLRSLPLSAYDTVNWSATVPHI